MPFQPGENVGPYRIIEQLGQGGMATVFKAYHAALDRYVAIKAMHPAFMQDPQFLKRFQREARVVARLDHANIVPVFDFADQQGQPYLVMKFIEGETLKAALDVQWPDKARILEIVHSVGSALTYAHAQGVLHRDVKPSNILLAGGNGIYLADFGLARMAEAGQSTLSGDQLLGTPHYISPEQARAEQDLDQRTDIYSFGIVLYQLAVGRVPYNSDTPFSIIHDHIFTPLPMPRALNEKIPEDLERVLLKALAKEPDDRFGSVEELVRAFDNAVHGVSPWESHVVAAPAVVKPTGRIKARSSTRRWAWAGGGLLLSLACIMTFFLAMAGADAAKDQVTTQPADVAGLDEIPISLPPPEQEPASPGGESLPGAIPAAWQQVNADPNNPAAHAELAYALAAEGDIRPARSEFAKAAELYLAQDAYVDAADVLVGGIEATNIGPGDDLRVATLLAEALFLGAETGEMLSAIEALYQLSPEWSALPALDARSLLYGGELIEATGMLESVLVNAPEDMIANAVMVDALHLAGEDQQALQLASKLLSRPRKPPWLTEHLEQLHGALSS